MKDYKSQYKNPKWQKKRLEIMQRDGFKCQLCHNDKIQLNVHHRYYIAEKDVWDYSHWCYITLCNVCHYVLHDNNVTNTELAEFLKCVDEGHLLEIKIKNKKLYEEIMNG